MKIYLHIKIFCIFAPQTNKKQGYDKTTNRTIHQISKRAKRLDLLQRRETLRGYKSGSEIYRISDKRLHYWESTEGMPGTWDKTHLGD